MNTKKQIKKMIKTVEKNPVMVSAIVTGAIAVASTAGVMIGKIKAKKVQK